MTVEELRDEINIDQNRLKLHCKSSLQDVCKEN